MAACHGHLHGELGCSVGAGGLDEVGGSRQVCDEVLRSERWEGGRQQGKARGEIIPLSHLARVVCMGWLGGSRAGTRTWPC